MSTESGELNRGVGERSYFETWYSSRDWTFYLPLVTQILQHSRPGPILDAGAGVGYLVECCQRWGLDAEGIEGSAAAVEIGRERFAGLRLRHLPLSESFPFEPGSFQSVVMNQVIGHLEPVVVERALREIFRVLRPGGMLMILSPSKSNRREWGFDHTHINMGGPSELRALLVSAGFGGIVSFDEPRLLLGSNFLGRRLMRQVFKLTHWDRLSASVNVRAYK